MSCCPKPGLDSAHPPSRHRLSKGADSRCPTSAPTALAELSRSRRFHAYRRRTSTSRAFAKALNDNPLALASDSSSCARSRVHRSELRGGPPPVSPAPRSRVFVTPALSFGSTVHARCAMAYGYVPAWPAHLRQQPRGDLRLPNHTPEPDHLQLRPRVAKHQGIEPEQ